jgi:thymidylate synthase
MQQYLDLCEFILKNGERKSNRTGVDTIGIFGTMMKFDLQDGFPILTTKKILFDTVVDELLWFLRGGHNIHDADAPKRIWDDWADKDGELGRIYGVQWREWKSYVPTSVFTDECYSEKIDQLQLAIDRIKRTPNSRRNIVSAWNVGELEQNQIGFPPCHVMFQFHVGNNGTQLNMTMYQRSVDTCVGAPFNISSYSLLLTLIANECNLVPGIFTHFMADTHIYINHIENVKKQLCRNPYPLPSLLLHKPVGTSIFDIRKSDIELVNYQHHGFLKYGIAV